MKKHLVYAEDMVYEIMQYPSHSISKSLIRDCAAKVVNEKPVSVWQYLKDRFTWWFKKDA